MRAKGLVIALLIITLMNIGFYLEYVKEMFWIGFILVLIVSGAIGWVCGGIE